MSIESITEIENTILARMPKGGYFEDRDEYFQSHNIYQEWRYVFERYVELAISGEMEALKRALFFLWYQCSEPNQLSGLNELDEQLILKVLKKVNYLVETENLDTELTFMLPFYFQVCEWYFERFTGMDCLLDASKAFPDLWESEAPKQNWGKRGVMGGYWTSKSL